MLSAVIVKIENTTFKTAMQSMIFTTGTQDTNYKLKAGKTRTFLVAFALPFHKVRN